MRVNPLPSKRALLATALILLAMLAVGSFADYPISLALYHPDNPLAKLLAGFGAGSSSPAGPWRRRSPPGTWIFLFGWRPSPAWAARG